MNSESIHLNSYTWIHILMYSYFHFIYEFRCIWIHIIISYMNSYNDYMNSYVYEFISWYTNSYMNSYISWIHIWIRLYQGSRWQARSLSVTNRPVATQSRSTFPCFPTESMKLSYICHTCYSQRSPVSAPTQVATTVKTRYGPSSGRTDWWVDWPWSVCMLSVCKFSEVLVEF